MYRVKGEYDLMTDEIRMHRYGTSVGWRMWADLPATIQGRGSLLKTSPVDFLDHEMPGMAYALYEWFEPESAGELVGELLSSYRGQPYEAAHESEEDS
jgi:hypothetical protein